MKNNNEVARKYWFKKLVIDAIFNMFCTIVILMIEASIISMFGWNYFPAYLIPTLFPFVILWEMWKEWHEYHLWYNENLKLKKE